MSMTRSEKLARADEIFAHVWGDNGVRESYDAIEVAVCDLTCAADDMEVMRAELDDNPEPHILAGVQSTLTAYAKNLRELAARLEAIDLEEKVA